MKSILGMRARAFACIGILASALAPIIASAEEAKPVGADAGDPKQRVKEAEEHLRHERKELHEALRDGGSAEHIKELDKEVAAASGALAEAKLHAKEMERAHLVKKGYVIAPVKLRGEWRKHAQRIAKLRRIRELAAAADDSATAVRADSLIAKENERHEHWIDKRRGEPSAPPAASMAVAVAPSADSADGGAP
jgi:hypothetical protein